MTPLTPSFLLSSEERGTVGGFRILNLVHWVFGLPARSRFGIGRYLGFGVYCTLWMISSNSFLSRRFDNDSRIVLYSAIVSN
jgi:hypothetical protein